MPYHSSVNYHKAEYQEDCYAIQKEWEREKDSFCITYCMMYNGLFYYDKCGCCDKYPDKCQFEYKWCSCNLCYDFRKLRDRNKLLQKYYSYEEIIDTLQIHMSQTNCTSHKSYPQDIIKINKVYAYALQPSLPNIIPNVIDLDKIPPCVIKILEKDLLQRIKKIHSAEELNRTISTLRKYGVSYKEYLEFRKYRAETLKELQKPKNTVLFPKQKFLRVKESQIKTGDFKPKP